MLAKSKILPGKEHVIAKPKTLSFNMKSHQLSIDVSYAVKKKIQCLCLRSDNLSDKAV